MAKKTKEELKADIQRIFPEPYEEDPASTPEQVLWYVQMLRGVYEHPDHRIKEILKDWAIHSWHLMHDCLQADWRHEWPYSLCHYLATIGKHYEEPTQYPSGNLSLAFRRHKGFSSAFSNEFARSDFVITDNDSGIEIASVELMRVVGDRLEAEVSSSAHQASDHTDASDSRACS